MKTILMPIFQAVEVKNILRTGITDKILKEPDVKIICLTRTPERAKYYKDEFSHERIHFDSFYKPPDGLMERLFSFLKFYTFRTATTDLRRLMVREDSGNHFMYYAGFLLNIILARKSARAFLRLLDKFVISDVRTAALLEKYRPNVLFLSNLFDDVEISLLRESKRKKIATVGFINSWDRTTARSAIRLLPESLIVYNNLIKDEVIKHADMPEKNIIITGIPQYDQYIQMTPNSREEFFEDKNLNPNKHLILVAPWGKKCSDHDWNLIDLLHSIISDGSAVPNAELLVRFQPNDFVDMQELASRPWLKYDIPGIRFGTKRAGGDWDMTFKDLIHLTDTLAHTSVLINYSSSLSIDAIFMGKPVININFEMGPLERISKSPTHYYYFDHYKKALDTGAIRLVDSRENLIYWINKYIENPDHDLEGRQRLMKEQFWIMDGKASERIAYHILSVLDDLKKPK